MEVLTEISETDSNQQSEYEGLTVMLKSISWLSLIIVPWVGLGLLAQYVGLINLSQVVEGLGLVIVFLSLPQFLYCSASRKDVETDCD